MARVTTTVVVRYDGIAKMHARGGDIYRYVSREGRRTAAIAFRLAPKRSGRMASSIRVGDVKSRAASASVNVTVSTRYALYVIDGTRGPIGPHTAKYMRLRPGNGHPRTYAKWVHGQRANNFMDEALNRAMRQPYAGLRLKANPFA